MHSVLRRELHCSIQDEDEKAVVENQLTVTAEDGVRFAGRGS